MLKLISINKGFGIPGEENYRQVLKDLEFTLEDTESVAIVGPSGSGKTTLLNITGTLDHPDTGEVLFRERDLGKLTRKEKDHFRNREIGFVFQFHHLLPQCSLLENVLLPAMVTGDRKLMDQTMSYAEKLLKKTGIWDHRDKLPGKMSGGECQRAAVVRAMINKPSLLLADEPTGALDAENAEMIADLLLSMKKEEGTALLVVTHSIELASKMDRILKLENGHLSRN